MPKDLGQADIVIKRIYDPADPADGTRVLVDRLWPRGLSKAAAHLDRWAKDVAPSPGLRRWFNHETEKFDSFARRYTAELRARPETLEPLLESARKGRLTLLYAARDPDCNHARVLRDLLQTMSGND